VSASHVFEVSTKFLAFEQCILKFQDASGQHYEKVLRIRDITHQGDTPFLLLITDRRPQRPRSKGVLGAPNSNLHPGFLSLDRSALLDGF